jgi:hypothetical protein
VVEREEGEGVGMEKDKSMGAKLHLDRSKKFWCAQ